MAVKNFTATGSGETWVVPPGVTSITVDMAGAQGGAHQSGTPLGGLGGRVQATLNVTPGETLYIGVGTMGTVGAILGEVRAGGFYLGGNGRNDGGGGGGQSYVKRGDTADTSRVLVAGGGGGGAPGTTQNPVRNGGAVLDNESSPFRAGQHAPAGNDGGGGGGWYGGGTGGGGGQQGGGGSNMAHSTQTSGVTSTSGFRTGDGYVTFTYTEPTHTRTFASSGSTVQTFTVPLDVTSIVVDMAGARGGHTDGDAGGRGGRVQATLAVTPGELLRIRVGKIGISGTQGGAITQGGFPDGGDGSAAGSPTAYSGGAGGGSTDIRRGGDALSNRVLVAGAGGGGDQSAGSGPAGDGGHTLHTESTPSSLATDGTGTGPGGLLHGVGGGGGGWVGGTAGTSDTSDGYGKGGSSMAHSTQTSGTTSIRQYQDGDGYATLSYTSSIVSNPSELLTWYLNNATTVDTGTNIDVRAFTNDPPPGPAVAEQNFVVDNTGDSVNRWWDPATFSNTSNADSANALLRRGWAIPLNLLTPEDTRCRVFIPAQTVTVTVNANLSWTGTPIGSSDMSARASLWRYNPATDVGSKIASNQQAYNPWGGVGQPANGAYQGAQVNIVVPDTILERDEVLLVQLGVVTGTLANPLTDKITYTSHLRHGTTTSTRLTFASPMRAICAVADTQEVVGFNTRGVALKTDRPVDARGNSTKNLVIVFTDAGVNGVGTSAKTLRVYHSDNPTGYAQLLRVINARVQKSATGTSSTNKVLTLNLSKTLFGLASGNMSRYWEAFRIGSASGKGEVLKQFKIGTVESFSANGQSQFTRYWRAYRSGVGEIVATPIRGIMIAKAVQELAATGTIDFARYQELARNASLMSVATSDFGRVVVFVRTGSATAQGEIDPNEARISLPLSDLPTGSGTVSIRKIFPIFEG